MTDVFIFGFGLFVTILVGSGLASMISSHNAAIDEGKATDGVQTPETE